MILASFLLALAGDPLSGAEGEVVAKCASVSAAHAWMEEGTARAVEPHGLCFTGEITEEAASRFVSILESVGGNPVMVVNSGGGDVDAALDMAEAIGARSSTVIVDGVCASSCANYILPAGSRRIVARHSILAFHGGAVELSDDEWRRILQPLVPSDQLDAAVTSMREENARRLARQEAFLRNVGIDDAFFRWMGNPAASGAEDGTRNCAGEGTDFIVISDARLRDHGFVVHHNGGPENARDLAEALAMRRMIGGACYVE